MYGHSVCIVENSDGRANVSAVVWCASWVKHERLVRWWTEKNGRGFTNDSIGRCNFFLIRCVLSSNTVLFRLRWKRWQKCWLRGLFARILKPCIHIFGYFVCFQWRKLEFLILVGVFILHFHFSFRQSPNWIFVIVDGLFVYWFVDHAMDTFFATLQRIWLMIMSKTSSLSG